MVGPMKQPSLPSSQEKKTEKNPLALIVLAAPILQPYFFQLFDDASFKMFDDASPVKFVQFPK